MLHRPSPLIAGMTAGLQNVVKADDIRLHIDIRVVDGVAHARLGGKIHNDLGLIRGKERVQRGSVGQVSFDEAEAAARCSALLRHLRKQVEPVLFERDLIVIVHAVDADDVDPLVLPQQRQREEGADKARRPCDQYRLIVQIHGFSFFSGVALQRDKDAVGKRIQLRDARALAHAEAVVDAGHDVQPGDIARLAVGEDHRPAADNRFLLLAGRGPFVVEPGNVRQILKRGLARSLGAQQCFLPVQSETHLGDRGLSVGLDIAPAHVLGILRRGQGNARGIGKSGLVRLMDRVGQADGGFLRRCGRAGAAGGQEQRSQHGGNQQTFHSVSILSFLNFIRIPDHSVFCKYFTGRCRGRNVSLQRA